MNDETEIEFTVDEIERDEWCRCGHRRSEHNDVIRFLSRVRVVGHGGCKHKEDCGCEKFTFAAFVEE